MHKLICGDVLDMLPSLPGFACCFMDPPDAIGLSHNGYKERPRDGYMDWLAQVLESTIPHCGVTWLSYNAIWDLAVKHWAYEFGTARPRLEIKPFVQVFTFGQHCKSDCGNGHRPILRFRRKDAPLYPDQIKEASWRTLHDDKRAAQGGRVPDDVARFERVKRDTMPLPNWTPQDVERFLSRIDRRGKDECWEWTAGKQKGYGCLRIGDRSYIATRLMWRLTHGTDPIGQLVLHTCDNPGCCNPAHLYIGSDADNSRDREARKRGNHPRGQEHGLTSLTDADVLDIYKSNDTYTALGRRYDVSDVTARNIKNGLTWQHVTRNLPLSDVFDMPRVTGNSKQRRHWHPTQLNEALVERAIKLSTREGDDVLDLFSGTGTVIRVCKRIGRHTTSVELNPAYCAEIIKEHSLKPVSEEVWMA